MFELLRVITSHSLSVLLLLEKNIFINSLIYFPNALGFTFADASVNNALISVAYFFPSWLLTISFLSWSIESNKSTLFPTSPNTTSFPNKSWTYLTQNDNSPKLFLLVIS